MSAIAQNFDVAFEPGHATHDFDKNFSDSYVISLPPLALRFTPRVKV